MEEKKSLEMARKFGKHLFRYLLIYEILAFLVIALGAILLWKGISGDWVLSLGLLLGAMINFFVAFAPLADPISRGIDRLLFRINGWVVSISVSGILFTLQGWPGGNTLLSTGTVILLVLVLFMLIRKTQLPEQKVIRFFIVIKSLIVGIAGVILYMVVNKIFSPGA